MHTLGRVVWGNVLPASSDFFPLNLEEPNIGCRYYLGTLEDLGTDAPCLASGIAVVETNKKKSSGCTWMCSIHLDIVLWHKTCMYSVRFSDYVEGSLRCYKHLCESKV